MLSYIVSLFNDVAQGVDPDLVHCEFMRAANRLADIAAHWPEALSRHLDQQLAVEQADTDQGAIFNILCPGPGK